jgi:hypothetical protein
MRIIKEIALQDISEGDYQSDFCLIFIKNQTKFSESAGAVADHDRDQLF